MLLRTLTSALFLAPCLACVAPMMEAPLGSGSLERTAKPATAAQGGAQAAASATSSVGVFGGVTAGTTLFHGYEDSPGDDVDDTDVGFSAFAGYQASPYWAVLMGYVDFGGLTASGPSGGGFTDDIDYSGLTLLGMGIAPINERSAAFVTAGIIRWNQKVDYMDSFGPFDADESGVSPALGFGANYYLDEAETIGVHLSLVRFFDLGDHSATGHDNDVDLLSVGFILHP